MKKVPNPVLPLFVVFFCFLGIPSVSQEDAGKKGFGSGDWFSAARRGNVQKTNELIERNISVDSRDVVGKTALFIAAQYGNDQVVRRLIEAGASVNQNDAGIKRSPALIVAAKHGHKRVVEPLLKAGAIVRLKKEGVSALGWPGE